MIKELYNMYKFDYKDYLILIKSGNFYISLNNDAIIMNNIFNYKIKESSNMIRVGFPVSSLDKVVGYLDSISVNYLVIDKEIIEKQKYQNNRYNEFSSKYNYLSYLNRINNINNILKSNINKDISSVLDEIEDILCKTGF